MLHEAQAFVLGFCMSAISLIKAREILDSRGVPTLEVDIVLEGGAMGRASVPSGASTGAHEAIEKRDQDPKRYNGKGVRRAVASINGELSDLLLGTDGLDLRGADSAMLMLDTSEGKSLFGANAFLGISLALVRAAAAHHKMPVWRYLGGANTDCLPVPLMNILNGGVHADNAVDIQEFMIAPVGAPNFSEALRIGAEIRHALGLELRKHGKSANIGDEGGFAPELSSTRQALDFVRQAIDRAACADSVGIALDCAASSLFCKEEQRYKLPGENRQFTPNTLIEWLAELCEDYGVFSLEDPLAEDDWEGWRAISETLGKRVQLVGDDIFVTNQKRLAQGIKEKIANGALIKPNQIGTVSETIDFLRLAQSSGYACIMSHRSGETEDSIISDLAVAFGCTQIKSGAPARSERTAKYNQILRIEEALGQHARYAGPILLRSRKETETSSSEREK